MSWNPRELVFGRFMLPETGTTVGLQMFAAVFYSWI